MADLEQTDTHLHPPNHTPIASAQERLIQLRLHVRRSPHAGRDVLQRPLRHLAFFVNVPRIGAHRSVAAGWHRQDG